MVSDQKPIFTIRHGVQTLIAVDGVVRGKRVGALGACEPEVTLAGGTYIDLSPTEAYVGARTLTGCVLRRLRRAGPRQARNAG